MGFSSSAFSKFYESKRGVLASRFITARIHEIWPDVRHHSFLSIGFSQPFLADYPRQAARTVLMTPPGEDSAPWLLDDKNILCVGKPDIPPFDFETFDRILMIHLLEFTQDIGATLAECWRILKPNGRMLILVPNRLSIWARTEGCPFAYGTPFTFTQIKHALIEHNFYVEQQRKALFVPPFENKFMLSLSPFFEAMGKTTFKSFGGVHVIEVSKKVYAPIKPDKGSAIEAASRILIPAKPALTHSR